MFKVNKKFGLMVGLLALGLVAVGCGERWQGLDGTDGRDGRDGIDGKDGKDGVSPIVTFKDGNVMCVTMGTEPTLCVVLPAGVDGKDGVDGVDGKDGIDGTDGVDGKDGVDGVDGKDCGIIIVKDDKCHLTTDGHGDKDYNGKCDKDDKDRDVNEDKLKEEIIKCKIKILTNCGHTNYKDKNKCDKDGKDYPHDLD